MVTYGDMVTLLLTFFVFIVSMANYENFDENFRTAMQSIRQALGAQEQKQTSDASVNYETLAVKLESIIQAGHPDKQGSPAEKELYRRNLNLRRTRDGMQITMGGDILFGPFSAKIDLEGKEIIRHIGQYLKGCRNKIEITGYAADQPKPVEWSYDEAKKLSYRRVEAVANELMLHGVDPRTLAYQAEGDNVSAAQGHDHMDKRSRNRRVEIIISKTLIGDQMDRLKALSVNNPTPATKPANAG